MVLGILEVSIVITAGMICAAVAGGIVINSVLRKRNEKKKKRLRKPRNSLQQYPSFVANRITGMITIVPQSNSLAKDELLVCPQYLIALAPGQHPGFHHIKNEATSRPTWRIGDDCLDLDNNNNVCLNSPYIDEDYPGLGTYKHVS